MDDVRWKMEDGRWKMEDKGLPFSYRGVGRDVRWMM
jgi:hypothetical protein